jgi:hypothetical protein
MKKSFLLLLYVFVSLTSFSQDNKDALIWFDNVIGQKNIAINSGVKYTKKHVTLKGNHNFLFQNKFYKGNVNYDN